MPRPARLLALSLAALVAALLGCDRRVEPWVEPEDEPPRVEQPVRVPGLGRPVPRARIPEAPSSAASGQRVGSAAGEPIRGTIRLADGVSVPAGGIVFVVARGAQPGPPLAALRLPASGFPLSFQIGPDDVMIQGRPFVGPISLSARIDTDGDPLTREPGAPAATLDAPLEPGASGVELVLRSGG